MFLVHTLMKYREINIKNLMYGEGGKGKRHVNKCKNFALFCFFIHLQVLKIKF